MPAIDHATVVLQEGLTIAAGAANVLSEIFDMNGWTKFNPFFKVFYGTTHAGTTGLQIKAQYGIPLGSAAGGILWADNLVDLTPYLVAIPTAGSNVTKVTSINQPISTLAPKLRFSITNTDVSNSATLDIYGDI